MEFDVQLSVDKIPIVYHDFNICLSIKKVSDPPPYSAQRAGIVVSLFRSSFVIYVVNARQLGVLCFLFIV